MTEHDVQKFTNAQLRTLCTNPRLPYRVRVAAQRMLDKRMQNVIRSQALQR